MLTTQTFVSLIKCLVFSSVVFVWVVRYQNIVEEFKQFGYSQWLRDCVGIMKLTCVVLILNSDIVLVHIGSAGIAILMIAALGTHVRVKNPLPKMIPSFTLLVLSTLIFFS